MEPRVWTRAHDFGVLILRLAIGGLMLFHGISKVTDGIAGIEQALEFNNLPAWMAYGVYVGEVAAPILIIIGFLTRPAAFILAFNMVVAVGLAHFEELFVLRHGAWALELQGFYFFGALALLFLGAGRFSVSGGRGPCD